MIQTAPTGVVFYIIDDAANNVWIVDPTTAVNVNAGMITPSGETFTGLEFDPITGMLFGLSTNGMGTSTLSTINLNTLAQMAWGAFQLPLLGTEDLSLGNFTIYQ